MRPAVQPALQVTVCTRCCRPKASIWPRVSSVPGSSSFFRPLKASENYG